MKISFFLVIFLFGLFGFSQTEDSLQQQSLFDIDSLLTIRLSYPSKTIKKVTNDSVYIGSELSYLNSNSKWKTLPIKIQSRGAFRKHKCYFTPLKIKIKQRKKSIFKDNKKLKLVLPCLKQRSKNDNVIKEYLVYKMYEKVSEYHFKTQLIDVDYKDTERDKIKPFSLKGIFIEDVKRMAKRYDSNLYKRPIHPGNYSNIDAVRHAIFQYMVGNTDFSVTYQHNMKLIFKDKIYIPIPYDFDLSGFVNTSYSLVSEVRKTPLPIENVTERYYMGYKRDYKLFEIVRQEFINLKPELLTLIINHKSFFENDANYKEAITYILSFFEILNDEVKFKSKIFDKSQQI